MSIASIGMLIVVGVLCMAWRAVRFQRTMKEGWKDIANQWQEIAKSRGTLMQPIDLDLPFDGVISERHSPSLAGPVPFPVKRHTEGKT